MKKFKRRSSCVLFILSVFACLFLSISVSAANHTIVQTSTTYSLKSGVSTKGKSMLLDVYYGKKANGTKIDVSAATYKKQQVFRFVNAGGGFYYIQDTNSGKVLMVKDGKKANGIDVVLYSKTTKNADPQLWKLTNAGSGYYYIQNKMGYYLFVKGASTQSGTPVRVGSKKQTKEFKWKLEGYVKKSDVVTVDNISLTDYKCGSKYPSSSYYARVNNKNVYMAATQCMGFAHYVQYKMYGTYNTSNVCGSISAKNLTENKLKQVIMNAGVGAHIRTGGKEHSLIVIGITPNGFTIADANGTAGSHTVGIKTYTWEKYKNSWGKRGIKFIQQKIL